ncbi:hypothetical protein QTP81_09900 [Alteromonas sp. ASW11-36]|uniref:Uncharacterized protein n=1 Tax=Alteromonas arenosi TaxID=3055817 RepID=A0ABT7SXJ1_9ALTE|nr:hypothetical protein [Alteromonas sp. ASW11-36]MDM7860908.1 hypothetical protein [Alteromonas sp. ASW11-36]
MNTLTMAFTTLFLASIGYFILLMGSENWLYFIVLPPLFFGLFMMLAARIPRTKEEHNATYEKCLKSPSSNQNRHYQNR